MKPKSYIIAAGFALALTLLGSDSVRQSYGDNVIPQLSSNSQTEPDSKTISGTEFKNVEITGYNDQGQQLRFQIRDAQVDRQDPDGEIVLYKVFYQDPQDEQWKNLCQEHPVFGSQAIVLSGSWDRSGNHTPSDQITFSCNSGVLAKCTRFGYKPWQEINGKSLRDLHQACTRMMRADYCGDGTPHTRDGTTINLYDLYDIQKSEPNDQLTFEAAWSAQGATCIDHFRWPKLAEDVKQTCPEKVNACSSFEEAKQKFPESLIFNDSRDRQPE